jgi:Ca-activated chloride channel homolog
MAMKRLVIILGFTFMTSYADAALNWQSLWHTPDQEGEALLQQGKAQAAANAFVSPRHKAYAQLQAGQYAQAEKGFSQFHDADAYYNRGNAFAHMNQLPQALQAYEQALKVDPNNKDAAHNRDLVKKALKEQQNKDQQKQNQQNKDQQNKDQQNKDQQNKDQQSQPQDKQNQQNGNNSQAGSSQHNQQSQNPEGQKQAQQNQQSNSAPSEKEGNKSQGASSAQRLNQPNKQVQGMTKQEKDNKEKAENDAKAGMAAQQNQPAASINQQLGSPPAGSAENASDNEQKMAQKQWLKQIPDDPSGLLRRKLLVEHLMRQRSDAQ